LHEDFINQNLSPTTNNLNRYKPLLDAGLFALITLLLHYLYYNHMGWLTGSPFHHTVAGFLAEHVFRDAMWVNRLFGYEITADYATNTLYLSTGYITVSEGCSGFKQDYQLLGLFLLYPGPWKHKLWYIPASFAAMHFTNILRIVILTAILRFLPSHWDFWHEWIMRPFYYVVIFGLWVVWNTRIKAKG